MHTPHSGSPSSLRGHGAPLLARVHRLLGKWRRRCFLVRVVASVEVDLHVLRDERSALVNRLHLLQPLLVLVTADVLDQAAHVLREGPWRDVLVDHRAHSQLGAVVGLRVFQDWDLSGLD